ncbi:hypothetical protein GCM10018952_57270 [Streptosporangium vulgare]
MTLNTIARPNVEKPVKGGTVTWACAPGFPPSIIFPFTPPERFGTRNLLEFQILMYRPLYFFGTHGTPEVDYDLSIGEPPQWSEDGLTVTVTVKPWKWSNGETICADNVLFWVNMMAVKGERYGEYVPGCFPDNLVSYGKLAEDKVYFTFDKVYSKRWVLMNQLSTITPMPKAWDRTADGPSDASYGLENVAAVYDFLMGENGGVIEEDNSDRVHWATSPVWSVVSGPWRLKSYTMEGVVTFVPNEHYSGPNKPHLDEFRQIPFMSDGEEYQKLLEGPDAPDGIQVGYLPLSFSTEPTDDPHQGRPQPAGRRLHAGPAGGLLHPLHPAQLQQPDHRRQDARPDLHPAGDAARARPGPGGPRHLPRLRLPAGRAGAPLPGERPRLAHPAGFADPALRRRAGPRAAGGERLGHQHDTGGLRQPRHRPRPGRRGHPRRDQTQLLPQVRRGTPRAHPPDGAVP